jgi:hypothetical protein
LAKFDDFIWNTCFVKISKLVTPSVVSHNIAQFCSHGCEEITYFLGLGMLQTRAVYDIYLYIGAHSSIVGSGIILQAIRSQVQFPMSLDLLVDLILPATLWPWGGLSL